MIKRRILRGVAIGFVTVIVLLLLMEQAEAQTEGVPLGCAIYTLQESVEKRGHQIERHFKNQRWDWGEGENDPYETIKSTIIDLVRRGVPPQVLEGVRIYSFPLEYLPRGTKNIREDAGGLVFKEGGWYEIWLAAKSNKVKANLVHEIGHIVHDRLMKAPLYDWSLVNDDGKEFLRLKQYPSDRNLRASTQEKLPWWERASEWFAEDFQYLYVGDSFNWHKVGIKPDQEVKLFFARLFLKNGGYLRPHL